MVTAILQAGFASKHAGLGLQVDLGFIDALALAVWVGVMVGVGEGVDV